MFTGPVEPIGDIKKDTPIDSKIQDGLQKTQKEVANLGNQVLSLDQKLTKQQATLTDLGLENQDNIQKNQTAIQQATSTISSGLSQLQEQFNNLKNKDAEIEKDIEANIDR